MKEFLENIVKNIVENPDSVTITETEDQGRVSLMIKVADSDMGRVIGKDGKVINSIRMILRVMAIRQDLRVRVDIEDNRGPKEPQQPTPPPVNPVEQTAPVEPPMPAVTDQPAPQIDTEEVPQTTAADFVGQPNQTTVIDNSGN